MEDIGGDHQIVPGRVNSSARDSVPMLGLGGIELEGRLDAVVGREVCGVGIDGGEKGGVVFGWLEGYRRVGAREVVDMLS